MPANEYLSPKERAKKFNTGNFTASQTGARQEAVRHAQNQAKMNYNEELGGSDQAFNDIISGKRKSKGPQ